MGCSIRYALLALFVLACAFGCGSSSSSPDPAAGDFLHYEVNASTHELDAATLAAVVSTGPMDGVVRFHGTPASLGAVKAGDVLLAGASATTPNGILRQVMEVKTDGGDLVIPTRPAPIQLAFKSLHARITGKKSGLVAGLPTQALHAVSETEGNIAKLHWTIFDQDKNPATKDDQLLIDGSAGGEVTFTVFIDLDWLDVPEKILAEVACSLVFPLCIPDLPNVKFGASIVAKASVMVDAEGAAAKSFDTGLKTIPGTKFDLPQLTAGPVVVNPSVDFVVDVAGSSSSRFKAHAGVSLNAHTSLTIGIKDGISFDPPTVDPPALDPPNVEATLAADVKASVGPELTLLFWDSFGPSIALLGYGDVHADTEKNPCWGIDAGADVRARFTLKIPWELFDLQFLGDLLGLSGNIIDVSFGPFNLFNTPNVVRGTCTPVPGTVFPPGDGPTDTAYKAPAFPPWSRRYTDYGVAYPYSNEISESKIHAEKTIDGAWLVSGERIQTVIKLAETGDVVWSKRIHIPAISGENVPYDQARSAYAAQALDTNIWVATQRFTLMKLDPDGDLVWAKRYQPDDLGIAQNLNPVGLVTTKDGGAVVLSALQDTSLTGPVVLYRVDGNGKLLWSKTFHYETDTNFAPAIFVDGDNVVISGFSRPTGGSVGHVAKLDANGNLIWAKTLSVCGSPYVKPGIGFKLANGAYAVVGTYGASPQIGFIAQMPPDGTSASVASFSSGNTLVNHDINSAVELPITGFLTSAERGGSDDNEGLLLATHDARGTIVSQKKLAMKAPTGVWITRPGAVRLTNDGGALVFARVATSVSPITEALWVSKLPARTMDGPWDASKVVETDSPGDDTGCSVMLGADPLAFAPFTMKPIDVAASIVLEATTGSMEKMIP